MAHSALQSHLNQKIPYQNLNQTGKNFVPHHRTCSKGRHTANGLWIMLSLTFWNWPHQGQSDPCTERVTVWNWNVTDVLRRLIRLDEACKGALHKSSSGHTSTVNIKNWHPGRTHRANILDIIRWEIGHKLWNEIDNLSREQGLIGWTSFRQS